MRQMRSVRGVGMTGIAALATLVASATPAVADASSAARDAEGVHISPQTAADIGECLRNPNVPADREVDRSHPTLPDRPDTITMNCGNREVYGARHIHAGHTINNPVTFAECYVTATAASPTPTHNPARGSLVFNWAGQNGGPGVTVAIDDQDHDVITAYTHGPNSAAWDACAASIPGP